MIIDVVVASTSRYARFGSARSPEEADDLSGQLILERIKAAGHIARYALLPDGLGLRQAAEKSDADALISVAEPGSPSPTLPWRP